MDNIKIMERKNKIALIEGLFNGNLTVKDIPIKTVRIIVTPTGGKHYVSRDGVNFRPRLDDDIIDWKGKAEIKVRSTLV